MSESFQKYIFEKWHRSKAVCENEMCVNVFYFIPINVMY